MNTPINKKQYKVIGMDCADCALHVENAVKKVPGASGVKVDLLSEILEFEDSAHQVSDDEISKAVKAAGYDIVRNKRTVSRIIINNLDIQQELVKIKQFLNDIPEINEIRSHAKHNSLDIIHSLPVPELLARIEQAGFDISLSGSVSRLVPAQKADLIRTGLSALFLVTGFILYHSVSENLPAIISFLLAIVIGGYPIARKGFKEIIVFQPGMNFLMTTAVTGAMILGEWTEGAMVVFLFAFAQLLESRSMDRARKAIGNLMEERPQTARILTGTVINVIPVEQVRVGMTVAVKPGEQIPVDGIVTKGSSYVDRSMITGESMPVEVTTGAEVYTGTLNQNGYLEIETRVDFRNSAYNKISELVTKAQQQKAPRQNFVEKFARYYTPLVMLTAFLIALLPPLIFAQDWIEWIYRALVVLVIACPCAFVISTPVTIISGLTNAMKRGILIKGGLYLENFAKLKVIAFDKTGTITEGSPSVEKIIPFNGYEPEYIISLAAALESHSDHPLAKAIVSFTPKTSHPELPVKNLSSLEGRGIQGEINGVQILVGNHRLFEEKGWCDNSIHQQLQKVEDENHTTVLVGENRKVVGIIAITDRLRIETQEMIKELTNYTVDKVVMLTGDNQQTAESISTVAGIDTFFAELLPQDKLKIINELREKYGNVAMVGDGVNDAPALAAADIGIAMGVRGSDTALETADIALMDDDLKKLPFLKKLSMHTLNIVRQNIFIALILKFGFLLLAIPGIATLWMAVFADMGASLIVIFNGLRVLKLNEKG